MSWVERAIEKSRIVSQSTGYLTEVQSFIIDSCLARRDLDTARQHIIDWNRQRDSKESDISKWTPGDHFYALDKKFSTLGEAIDYLRIKGFRFSGNIRERYAYRESGG